MIYFTSDLHFFHDNIIRICNRPFETTDEMNAILIRNWNETVCQDDQIYFLGDFTLKGSNEATEILKQLNGRKYLVRGNHDLYYYKKDFDRSLFEWSRDYYLLHYKKMRFALFHYPIEDWDFMYYGSYHLHGHQHNKPEYNLSNREKGLKKYDVGADANLFRPVSIEQIISFFGGIKSSYMLNVEQN